LLREGLCFSVNGENGVGHARRFHGGFYIMRAQDMHALEDERGVRGEVAVKAVGGNSIFSAGGQCAAEE